MSPRTTICRTCRFYTGRNWPFHPVQADKRDCKVIKTRPWRRRCMPHRNQYAKTALHRLYSSSQEGDVYLLTRRNPPSELEHWSSGSLICNTSNNPCRPDTRSPRDQYPEHSLREFGYDSRIRRGQNRSLRSTSRSPGMGYK